MGFAAGVKQHEQRVVRQGQKWSPGGWALQQFTLLSLAFKMKKTQQNHTAARIPYCLMLVKEFKVTHLSLPATEK